jgi:hypothetical protein
MSAWFVFAAMGLYPVCPCSDEYVLGAPLFERVTLQLEGGQSFTIRAPAEGQSHTYVQAASLNGEPLSRSYLHHAEITGGGELVLTLGPRPDPQWGSSAGDRPSSRGGGERVLAAPFARAEHDRFRQPLSVELDCAEPDVTIRYTIDAERPVEEWTRYSAPLVLNESTRLRFVARKDGKHSPVVESYFHRIPNDWTIDTRFQPNGQYTAGGPDALVDALRGSDDWRLGGWQGYQETDFEATVDFGARRSIGQAGAGFLQDARSWIWMPAEVVLSVSDDGVRFREVARLSADVPDDEYGTFRRDLVAVLEGIEARYLRILARNYGTIPQWHPGRGHRAFIFVDEILVD